VAEVVGAAISIRLIDEDDDGFPPPPAASAAEAVTRSRTATIDP
jgi:hypothetical protein